MHDYIIYISIIIVSITIITIFTIITIIAIIIVICCSYDYYHYYYHLETNVDPDGAIIAYYCRTYAMEKGIAAKISTPAVNTFLMSLMDKLEITKKKLNINDVTGAETCENYAYGIFSIADNEDRAGNATKETAKIFYTASTFFDILEQFGKLQGNVQEKRIYSKYKAADILTAIKQGRKPAIGAPGEVFIFDCLYFLIFCLYVHICICAYMYMYVFNKTYVYI